MLLLPVSTIGEYLEDGYKPAHQRLSDEVYGAMLDSVVVACVDIAIIHNNQLLLGKRARHPQKDWWIAGGRMLAGETFAEAAARLLQIEVGLNLSVDRFSPLTVFSAAWNKRAFAPEDNGTHTISIVMTCEVGDDEAATITLNDEYTAMDWVAPTAIDDSYHPGLQQIATAVAKS